MSETTAFVIMTGMMGTVLLLAAVWYVIQVIALWRVFTKAGEAGWKSLIPFYNGYIQYKISWKTQFFWLGIICIIVGTVLNNMDGAISVLGYVICLAGTAVHLVAYHKLSLAFGHGVGFTLGLIFLNPIFILMLGFGGSQYQGPQN